MHNRSTSLEMDAAPDQFESEDDSVLSAPALLDGVVVTDSDWTTETILSQLQKENILLNPRFQRREAWDEKRQSKFIESVILGLPIPQLVLAEKRDSRGRYLVIDGKQRLLSLIKFAGAEGDSNFKLRGLEVRPDLNGKTWANLQESDLYSDDVAAFENGQIRTTTIRGWKDERALFLIFHRLNSGSVSLSPQELRHALHPGPFIDFAFDFTENSEIFIEVLGKDGKPDFRMRDVELLIRFIGLQDRLADYRGDLKRFLDDTVASLNKGWAQRDAEIEHLARSCELAIDHTISIFPEGNAFAKWNVQGPERRFNRAVFDLMTYYFADSTVRTATNDSDCHQTLRDTLQTLCVENPKFLKSLESTTKTTEALLTRLLIWGEAVSDIIKVEPVGYKTVVELAAKHGFH